MQEQESIDGVSEEAGRLTSAAVNSWAIRAPTTQIYPHVTRSILEAVRSPLDDPE